MYLSLALWKSPTHFHLNQGFEAPDPSYREYIAFLESASSVPSQPCWTPDISPFPNVFAWAAAKCQQGLPGPAKPLLLQGIQQNLFPRNAAKPLTLWAWEAVISHSDQILLSTILHVVSFELSVIRPLTNVWNAFVVKSRKGVVIMQKFVHVDLLTRKTPFTFSYFLVIYIWEIDLTELSFWNKMYHCCIFHF